MEYDDIIVGGGSAGAVLAARLSEEPARRVLLLEAGPDYATLESAPADIQDGWRMSLQAHDWALAPVTWGRIAVVAPLFVFSLMAMYSQAFNPFLYFQF